MFAFVAAKWNRYAADVTEQRVIAVSKLLAPFSPAPEVVQLHVENCCLKTIEPAVDALDHVFALSAMTGEKRRKSGNVVTVRDQAACVSHRAEIFPGIKRKRSNV